MIRLTQTYEIVTPESAECGEADERGFDFQDEPHTFRETVAMIERFSLSMPSDSHGVPRWITGQEEQDYRTGAWRSESLHPGRDSQSQRYWAKAIQYVRNRSRS